MSNSSSDLLCIRLKGAIEAFTLDVDLQLPAKAITAIYGPSGSGKTTLLRAICGLNTLEVCDISIAGEVWRAMPPHEREVGMVFQHDSLFPHLSVKENLTFGLKRTRAEKVIAWDDIISTLSLSSLLDRRTHNLSGGERKRVAIGRALLSQPRLLLLDEPLTGLDPNAKSDILRMLKALQTRLSMPMLYVTHDMHEVERIADWLVLLSEGRVIVSDTLTRLQSDLSAPLARRPDATMTLTASIAAHDEVYGLMQVYVRGGSFWLPDIREEHQKDIRIQIMASDVSIATSEAQNTSILNHLPALITDLSVTDTTQMTLRLALGASGDGDVILAKITRRSCDMLKLKKGMSVYVLVKSIALADDPGGPTPTLNRLERFQ